MAAQSCASSWQCATLMRMRQLWRWTRLALLLALVLYLAVSYMDRAEGETQASPVAESPVETTPESAPDPGPDSGPEPQAVGASTPQPELQPIGQASDKPIGEPFDKPIGQASGSAEAALRADRFSGYVYRCRRAMQSQYLGEAWQMLDLAHSLDLDQVQSEFLLQLKGQVQQTQLRAVNQLEQRVQDGEILAAYLQLLAMLQPEHREVRNGLASLTRAKLWPVLHLGSVTMSFAEADILPLLSWQRHRRLRVWHEQQVLAAQAWRCEPLQLTLRLPTPQGVTFPCLSYWQVEPVQASIDDAVTLARHALEPGKPGLARLWLCHCLARGAADQASVKALARLLAAPADQKQEAQDG